MPRNEREAHALMVQANKQLVKERKMYRPMMAGAYTGAKMDPLVVLVHLLVCAVLLGAVGSFMAYDSGYAKGLRQQAATARINALRQAREQVEEEMRQACGTWFTDSKRKAVKAGDIVVCKAPAFLFTTPTTQTGAK
jgi:hypothetical protein